MMTMIFITNYDFEYINKHINALLGYRVVEIKPLAEEQAMNGGASIVSEGLLLFTAGYYFYISLYI